MTVNLFNYWFYIEPVTFKEGIGHSWMYWWGIYINILHIQITANMKINRPSMTVNVSFVCFGIYKPAIPIVNITLG